MTAGDEKAGGGFHIESAEKESMSVPMEIVLGGEADGAVKPQP